MSDALLVKSIIPDNEYIINARNRTNIELDKLSICERKIEKSEEFNGTYFYFSYHGVCNKDLNKKIANTYLRLHPSLGWTSPHVLTWKAPEVRIRLGIISENLHQHSIGNTSSGLIKMLDRKRFEVIVIHLGEPYSDAMQDRINESADNFVYVSKKSLHAAREAIASLNLDIAFWQDIGMNPFSYFLSFARLAPAQCTTFGHPDTTGIPNMDYFISSDLYEIESSDEDYSEKLIRLPNAGTLSYYYKPLAVSDSNRQDFGLCVDDHLFMCLQTLFKLHPIMDDIFHKINQLDNKAKFVFIDPVDVEMRPAFTGRVFAKYPELESKFIFIKHTKDHNKYMQLLKCADVILDPVHFNGQNTDLEAFSLDLPIVTLPATLQRGRHTLGMYKKMGFLDLIALSSDHYANLANKLACDSVFSNYCRAEISKNKHVLYEDINFINNIEKALMQMLNR
ncbi:MAG: O-linked N-acetylglucosamine transferase family protein [Polaromonas sp.]